MQWTVAGVTMIAATVLSASAAEAWLLYPDRDDPALTIVEIEKATGETVALSALPVPFAVSPESTRRNPVFLLSYERLASARVTFTLDAAGKGEAVLDFTARNPSQDLKFGAVLIFLDKGDTALHALYARADLAGGVFADGTLKHRISFALERPQEWWRRFDKIAFFKMTYYPLQDLDDRSTWQAMRRAVDETTRGRGTDQQSR